MNASTVAAARREVPPILEDVVQLIGPTIRVADYCLPTTKRSVRLAVKALRGRMAALLANHGAVCVGRNLEEAFTVCLLLEKSLQDLYRSRVPGRGQKHRPH